MLAQEDRRSHPGLAGGEINIPPWHESLNPELQVPKSCPMDFETLYKKATLNSRECLAGSGVEGLTEVLEQPDCV